MSKRAIILLLICSFLAVTTLTIRYIEGEKEKIKEQFINLPQAEKLRSDAVPLR